MLRESGYDVYSIQEKHRGKDDPFVLSLAREIQAVILTFDRDYGELIYHRKMPVPIGVIYFRFDPFTPTEPAQLLQKYLEQSEIVFNGNFTVIERGNLRQRKLPKS